MKTIITLCSLKKLKTTNLIFCLFRLPVNFKNIIYTTVIQVGSRATWNQLYQKAIAETNYSEKLRMFRALASTPYYDRLQL